MFAVAALAEEQFIKLAANGILVASVLGARVLAKVWKDTPPTSADTPKLDICCMSWDILNYYTLTQNPAI